ncbi:MAG: Glutamate--cysteine ligase EgtA [Alphaproteobacteria bacterium MarineAlpha11_Bin1]|nr:MAG: Glutamate--cysteine ligase EgtA [Alphaproteobacteria bacterium MarineAlpha11_Bin1]|tara:strand:- start:1567 stop:2931 length:1365 start_codon:yes stop_codon:yes gene_type:complete
MSTPLAGISEPIFDYRQLVEHLEAGNKPRESWRIGTEHEKFVFKLDTLEPVPYEGDWGIRKFLEGLIQFGWEPILENGNPIALTMNNCNISLEPGGQLELSGAPLEDIHQTCDEVHTHLAQVKKIAGELGVGMLGAGFIPKWKREEISWMPKGRYKIMREYMPKKGNLGLDMMLRSCTVQVNLDFESESDMVEKFRSSLALQPVATALFANSPFVDGAPSGYQSYRSHLWEDTDPDRCGILPFVFEEGMGFERYVEYALDVPMYFIFRDGKYIDVSGQSFRDFLDGKLPGRPGEMPTLNDWSDHLTTIFPEVRLKRFLEMRGADGGPWRRLCALPAMWVGLLYDADCQMAAWDLVKDWTLEEHNYLRVEVPRQGLRTEFRGGSVQDVALQVLDIAEAGLKRRGVLDRSGEDETGFLVTLWEIAKRGYPASEELLNLYEAQWQESVDPIYAEFAY